jgi:hypothetical protein
MLKVQEGEIVLKKSSLLSKPTCSYKNKVLRTSLLVRNRAC